MSVATAPPALPEAAAAKVAKIEAALSDCGKKHKCKVRCTVFNKKLEVVWATQMDGVPGMMAGIAVAKARSFFDGKTLTSPGMCTTMCCLLCPYCCGCSNQMPVEGTIPFELEGTDAACMVINGAPAGSTDLAIANEMVGVAAGGAPDVASMTR